MADGGAIVADGGSEPLAGETAHEAEGLGEWVVRPRGRPRMSHEELVTITLKVPRSEREEIDRKAHEQGSSRSQFVRDALRSALL